MLKLLNFNSYIKVLLEIGFMADDLQAFVKTDVTKP